MRDLLQPGNFAIFGGLFTLLYAALILWIVFMVVRSLVWMSHSLREISATLTEISRDLRERRSSVQ